MILVSCTVRPPPKVRPSSVTVCWASLYPLSLSSGSHGIAASLSEFQFYVPHRSEADYYFKPPLCRPFPILSSGFSKSQCSLWLFLRTTEVE